MKSEYIISLDVGGTKILAAAINSTEGVVARKKKSTEIAGSSSDFAKSLSSVVDELLKESAIEPEQIKAITFGVPGAVNSETGIIGIAPNLGLKNYNIREELGKYISLPILIENDVNLAAMGISKFGVAKGLKNVLVVFIGTGIGAGLIFDGALYRGSSGVAGEIGHMNVQKQGPKCGCGKIGCLEALASRTAIVRDIAIAVKEGRPSILKELIDSKTPIKSKSLATALKKNDKLTKKVMASSARLVGRVLAGINNLLNLEMIVVGGGVVESNELFYLPLLQKEFKKYSITDAYKKVEITGTLLRDDAALFGGIALAEEKLGIKL